MANPRSGLSRRRQISGAKPSGSYATCLPSRRFPCPPPPILPPPAPPNHPGARVGFTSSAASCSASPRSISSSTTSITTSISFEMAPSPPSMSSPRGTSGASLSTSRCHGTSISPQWSGRPAQGHASHPCLGRSLPARRSAGAGSILPTSNGQPALRESRHWTRLCRRFTAPGLLIAAPPAENSASKCSSPGWTAMRPRRKTRPSHPSAKIRDGSLQAVLERDDRLPLMVRRARVMSGRRCFGSSDGNGLCTIFDLPPTTFTVSLRAEHS